MSRTVTFASGSRPGSVVCRGCDYLGDLVMAVTNQPGDKLLQGSLHPEGWTPSRIAQLGSIFDKFVFRKAGLVLEPTCPTTTAGSTLMYFDSDPVETPPDGTDGLRVGMAHQGASTAPLWSRNRASFTPADQKATYYSSVQGAGTDAGLRQTVQANFYVLCAGTPLSTLTVGQLFLEYEVEFLDAGLDTDSASSSMFLAAHLQAVNANQGVGQQFNLSNTFASGESVAVPGVGQWATINSESMLRIPPGTWHISLDDDATVSTGLVTPKQFGLNLFDADGSASDLVAISSQSYGDTQANATHDVAAHGDFWLAAADEVYAQLTEYFDIGINSTAFNAAITLTLEAITENAYDYLVDWLTAVPPELVSRQGNALVVKSRDFAKVKLHRKVARPGIKRVRDYSKSQAKLAAISPVTRNVVQPVEELPGCSATGSSGCASCIAASGCSVAAAGVRTGK